MRDIFDLYDVLIQSESIRAYFKQEWRMNALELEKLIIRANVPLTDKLSYLLWVRDKVAYGKDRRILAEMADLFEKVIKEIYRPKEGLWEYKVSSLHLESDRDDTELTNFFSTYSAVENVFPSYYIVLDTLSVNKRQSEHSPIPCYHVVQYVRQEDGSLDFHIAHSLKWIDGILSATSFAMPDRIAERLGVRQAVHYRIHETLSNFPLPSGKGIVRLMTPMMEAPLYGEVRSTLDEMDNWVHTFIPYGKKFKDCPPIDLSQDRPVKYFQYL